MFRKCITLLILVLGLNGCVNFEKMRDMPGGTQSLAFGYIDAAGAGTTLYRVRFAQAVPDDKEQASKEPAPREQALKNQTPKEQTMDVRVRGNAFYLENLPKGDYRIAHFVRRLRKMSYVVELPAAGPEARAFQIDKPGLYFVGSYKYTQYDRGDNKLEYEFKPAAWPTEKQVLEIILPQAQGTQWEDLIRKRIAELK